MRFRRKPRPIASTRSTRLPSEVKRRKLLRVKPQNADEVIVRLVAPGFDSIAASLEDIAMSGVGVGVPILLDLCLEPGAVVEVHLEHVSDGWVVDTPARVIHRRQASDLHVVYGLEFANVGNLYGQLDDAWAHYFSRREMMSFGIDLDSPMHVHLRQRHHRMDASVTDILSTFLGVRAPHHMAAALEIGKPARLFLDAWDPRGEFEVAVTLVNRSTLGQWDYLGVTIDEQQPERGAAARKALFDYVEERRRELDAREAG